MKLLDEQKKFILDNMKLIRDYNFDEFYEKWTAHVFIKPIALSSTGAFIQYFHGKNIYVENYINKIYPGMYAFCAINNLVIPSHIHVLDERAFSNTVLTRSIVIPETVTDIGFFCFKSSTITEVTIMGTPTINRRAFDFSRVEVVNVTDNYYYEKLHNYFKDEDIKLNYIT